MFNSLKMKKQLANLQKQGWVVGTVNVATNKTASVNVQRDADTVVIYYTPKRSIKSVEGRKVKYWNGVMNLFPYSNEDTGSFLAELHG